MDSGGTEESRTKESAAEIKQRLRPTFEQLKGEGASLCNLNCLVGDAPLVDPERVLALGVIAVKLDRREELRAAVRV